jgi:hypothetical protein
VCGFGPERDLAPIFSIFLPSLRQGRLILGKSGFKESAGPLLMNFAGRIAFRFAQQMLLSEDLSLPRSGTPGQIIGAFF